MTDTRKQHKLTPMNETLGEFIRRVRDEQDISLREVARQIGCTPPFLSDIELGRRNPSDKVLVLIAKALGVEEDELRSRDVRAPIEDIKRLTQADPRFAMAFRTVIDKNITAEQLQDWANKQGKSPNKRK